MFRNSSGADYPYDIAEMITITSSSANDPGYYYFFYNVEVEARNDPLTSIEPDIIAEPKLLRITNFLGQEVVPSHGEVLLYHFDDGSGVQKQVHTRILNDLAFWLS